MSLGVDDVLLEQVTAIKAQLAAYNAAILALTTTGIQSYQLDTGQTRQLVTKANLAAMQKDRSSLLNELTTLEARLCGTGAVHVVPSWG
jgi:hypothetical protein